MTERVTAAFFALLRSGLGLESLDTEGWWPLNSDEWETLYRQSRRHTVLGVVFDGLAELPSGEGKMPMELFARWAMDVEEAVKANRLQDAVLKAQKEAWARHGMEGIVLKGQTVAVMYPHPEHRASGDIDWWFGGDKDWHEANKIATANSCSLTEDSDGDVHYTLGGVMVEHHRRWNDASSRRARKALAGLRPDEPVAVLAMLNIHVLKHAMVLGIGMRQVCDLAMAYRYYDGQYDSAELNVLLERCGLKKWTALLNGVLVKCFGDSAVPDGMAAASGNHVDRLLTLILSDGNFGMETGRDAGSVAVSVWGRTGLFLRYAPGEFLARLWELLVGRMRRINRKK